MSVTTTIQGINELRGPSGPKGELRVFEIPVRVSGTYLTASKPSFDIAAELQACRFGVSALTLKGAPAVQSCQILRDRYDGTNRYTAPDGQIAFAAGALGNSKVTFRIDSGATNGATGTEVADGTDVSGIYVFLVVCSLTAE